MLTLDLFRSNPDLNRDTIRAPFTATESDTKLKLQN